MKRRKPSHRSAGTRTRRTEERIRTAGGRLLASGVGNLSMRAVADRAGITVGAIYKHFPSREALLDQLVLDAFSVFELRLLNAIAPTPPGSLARVIALGEEYIAFAQERSEEFRILFSPQRRKAVPIEQLPGMAGYGVIRRCVVEAMESGAFRVADPDLVSFFLWSRVHGIVMLLGACDFSSAMMPNNVPLTPKIAFHLTRELMAHGLLPVASDAGTAPSGRSDMVVDIHQR